MTLIEQLSTQEIKNSKIGEIRGIVAARIKPEWQQSGIPLDQSVIDQALETAARDVVDLICEEKRDLRNSYPGELKGGDERWYILHPLTLKQYQRHRSETDSWGTFLHNFPDVNFSANRDHTGWGVSIDPKDNVQYPG